MFFQMFELETVAFQYVFCQNLHRKCAASKKESEAFECKIITTENVASSSKRRCKENSL